MPDMPVIDDEEDVPWADEPLPPPDESPVEHRPRVVAIPVRDPGPSHRLDQRRDPAESRAPAQALQPTPEGDFWLDTVQRLVRAEAITALVRELGLQSQLVARDAEQWLLRIERESLNQGSTRDRLGQALRTLGHEVRLVVEIAPVSDSPALRIAAEAQRRQLQAEQIILDDPFVQQMMRDFGGKIVPGTLKPVDAPAPSLRPEGGDPVRQG